MQAARSYPWTSVILAFLGLLPLALGDAACKEEGACEKDAGSSMLARGAIVRKTDAVLSVSVKDGDPRLAAVEQQFNELVSSTRSPNSSTKNYTGHPEAQTAFNITQSLRGVILKMVSEAESTTQMAQQSAQQEAKSFEECHNYTSYKQKVVTSTQAHVQCRQNSSQLMAAATAIVSQKTALGDAKATACKTYEDMRQATHTCPVSVPESVEAWLLRTRDHFAKLYDSLIEKKGKCENATASYDAVNTEPATKAATDKEADCNATYVRLETQSCDAATFAVQLADNYNDCYDKKKQAYEDRDKEAKLEQKRVTNAKWAMHLLCKIDSLTSNGTSFEVNTTAFQACIDKDDYNTTHLVVVWPPTPLPQPPALPTAFPCSPKFKQQVSNGLPADSRLPACSACPGMPQFKNGSDGVVIMKLKSGSDKFEYHSKYWTDDSVLNENEGPADDADDVDAKLPAFNSQALSKIKVCFKTLSNCYTYDLGQEYASARELFSAGFIRSTNLGGGDMTAVEAKKAWTDVFLPPGHGWYNYFWNGGSGNGCAMQRPGINTQCRDGNHARIGYCVNCASQGCQASDSNDADAPIGIGLRRQSGSPINAPIGGYGPYAGCSAVDVSQFYAQAWLFALK